MPITALLKAAFCSSSIDLMCSFRLFHARQAISQTNLIALFPHVPAVDLIPIGTIREKIDKRVYVAVSEWQCLRQYLLSLLS